MAFREGDLLFFTESGNPSLERKTELVLEAEGNPEIEMLGTENRVQGTGQFSLRTAERMVASWPDPEAVASQVISRPSTRNVALTL